MTSKPHFERSHDEAQINDLGSERVKITKRHKNLMRFSAHLILYGDSKRIKQIKVD
jgi:hypothetical protein